MPFGSVIHPSPATILEESTIKELGSFVAYSNGRVRVVFSDRTILDMIHDFSLRISGNVSDVEVSFQFSITFLPITYTIGYVTFFPIL